MKHEPLQRFLSAQESSYAAALTEIKRGKKTGHWMWYIFPQIQGLGFSETAQFYAIKNLEEATAYLQHPVLGHRLVEISTALLQLDSHNAHQIFGSPDDLKLKSCMTLFSLVPNTNPVFSAVLSRFYDGKRDQKTEAILKELH